MPSDRRLFARFAVLVAASYLFFAGQVAAQTALSGEPPRVVAVRVVTESGAVLEQNPPKLTIQPGQPFSMEAEGTTLRELFRTGQYADLRAELTDVPGGVRLDYVVRQNYYINRVQIDGLHEPPGEPLALSALRLNLGETFRDGDMKEALGRLQQTLEDDGQYQSKLTYETTPHPDTLQMDILIHVTTGRRARIGAITIQNQTQFSDAELRGKLKVKEGQGDYLRSAESRGRPRTKMAFEQGLSRRASHHTSRRLRFQLESCSIGIHNLRGFGSSSGPGWRKTAHAHAAEAGPDL